jgi:hypothetical protein
MIVIITFFASVAVLLFAGHAFSQIRPYAENPSYWQYNGRPVLLFGGSDRDNIFQWAGDGKKLTDHLDLLRTSGGRRANQTRIFRCSLALRCKFGLVFGRAFVRRVCSESTVVSRNRIAYCPNRLQNLYCNGD